MKFFAQALAVAAPLGATAAKAPREGVGAIRGAGGAPARALIGADEDDLMTTCFALAGTDDCAANADCTWCKSGAVPSACYPASRASDLPAGVFECGAAAVVADVVLPPAAPRRVGRASQTFHLAEGLTHTLSSNEVDGGFCDASSPVSLAGYMNVKGSQFDTQADKNLFYWFFEKRTTSQLPTGGDPQLQAGDEETPLIVWLTGGPGCSSSLALLTENGPCSPTAGGAAAQVNQYSWTESAHVLWLDQPADVGYSYGQGNDSNEEMISEDAYYFLQAFFQSEQGSKYKDAPLHIVGESYGGHYAPAIAHRVWRGNKENKDLPNGLPMLNLKGLAVGNGLTDPETQYKHFADMAYNKAKIVSEATYNKMKDDTAACTDKIAECNRGDGSSFACQSAFLTCNANLVSPYRATGQNPYDYSKECGPEPLCYNFHDVETFMNSDATKEALHVKDHNPSWQTCNMEVNMNFHVDWMKNFAPYVADLLDAGVPALIYAGDLDYICNYLGNRAWTLNLDWKHKEEFNNAEEHDWNDKAGLARTANGLTFLQVYGAGHMVPSDQPANALKMITQHLMGQAF